MTPEGRIVVELHPGAATDAVKIASTRPLSIPRQFTGQAPEKIVQTVSLLFASCKSAQTIAAAEAFEKALGVKPSASTRNARAALILAETAREHALRVLGDWPKFLNEPEEPDAPALRGLMQAGRALAQAFEGSDALRIGGEAGPTGEAKAAIAKLKSLLEQAIFRCDLDDCSIMTRDELKKWAECGFTPAQRLIRQLMGDGSFDAGAAGLSPLPPLENGALAARLFAADADAFVAQPEWDGGPRETSALSRWLNDPLIEALKTADGYGIGARLVACLLELASIPSRLSDVLEATDASPRAPTHNPSPCPSPARLGTTSKYPHSQANADERGTTAAALPLPEGEGWGEGLRPLNSPPHTGGVGIAQIEAARGRLIHAVEMNGNQVVRYRILAPTEWNFHPAGAVAQGMARIAASSEGEACASLARLLAMSANPCVGADMRVS